MLRTIASVIAGYAAIATLFILTDILLGGALRVGRHVFTVVNLAMALPYGLAGGYVAARMSRTNAIPAVLKRPLATRRVTACRAVSN